MKPTRNTPFVAVLLVLVLAILACSRSAAPAGETPGAVEPSATLQPSNPCLNVFYPFVPDYRWVYKVTGEENPEGTEIGLTVARVENSQATLDMLDRSTGIITQTTVDCADGAIVNYPLLTLGTLIGDFLQGELTLVHTGGVFMPAQRDFEAANWDLAWTGDYTASGTISAEDEGETMTIVLQDSPIHMEWDLAGQEAVSVQAGTYAQAYKVTRRTEAEVALDVEGLVVQATLTIQTAQWYEAGVGLLKSVIESADLAYRGFSFPVEIRGEVELLEFRP